MKILIPKAEIAAEEKNHTFGFAHALNDPKLGEDDGAGNIKMDANVFIRIKSRYVPRPGQAPMSQAAVMNVLTPPNRFKPPTEEQVAAWLEICAACPFVLKTNDVLKCGHARQTCATCGQGVSGLKTVLKTYSFACPEKKLKP